MGSTPSVDGLMHSLPLLAVSGANHLRALSLVAGLIVECTLKAFLSHKGMTEKELMRRPYGHNLEELWLEAERRGLPILATLPDWCERLNELHFQVEPSGDMEGPAKHQLRYQTEFHSLACPVTEDLAREVPLLVEEVRRALRQP